MKPQILYVFGGEKAQGAEIVVERLMYYNLENVDIHLFISPGQFADKLIAEKKPYRITCLGRLKKLNRSKVKGISFYLKAIGNYISLSRRVYAYIKEKNIKIIHANTVVPASYMLPLILYSKLFLKGRTWVWSDHDISYYSKLDTFLSRLCLSLYDRTMVVSNAVMAKYPASPKLAVLYNGLDTTFFTPDRVSRKIFRHSYHFTDDTILLGMPAVVTPRKGQLDLIHVFNKLNQLYPNIRLLLAGGFEDATPGYSESVRNTITANDNVRHLGFIKDMRSFYNGCDIIINNSHKEGSEPLGTTIYEAMACGKVVLASKTGGTPEIISDNVDGLMFAADDSASLFEKLKWALHKLNDLDELKKAAVQKVKIKFNIRLMVEQYDQLLFSKK